jgi:pimeloyl-ACP methyl ester carboxylesterase
VTEILIDLPTLDRGLPGSLVIPPSPRGIVVFAHGSGSSRLSPRNGFVAETLQRQRVATLLFDLLTPQEDRDPQARFDIPLLTERLLVASDWLSRQDLAGQLPLGYFGASTGAAAALEAAAAQGPKVRAVVSRGGRPDLAGAGLLEAVTAPTLLIVGGDDDVVIGLNEKAMVRLRCEKELVIVPGATHLFEEPGTLAQAANHAADWFVRWFS